MRRKCEGKSSFSAETDPGQDQLKSLPLLALRARNAFFRLVLNYFIPLHKPNPAPLV